MKYGLYYFQYFRTIQLSPVKNTVTMHPSKLLYVKTIFKLLQYTNLYAICSFFIVIVILAVNYFYCKSQCLQGKKEFTASNTMSALFILNVK